MKNADGIVPLNFGDIGIAQSPAIIESLDPIIASVIVLLVAVLYAGSVAYRRSKTDSRWSVSELDDEEEDIVELLQENDGKINQKEISNEMEFSDAKTSRLTSSLINKNAVDKVREERQNYVTINSEERSEDNT